MTALKQYFQKKHIFIVLISVLIGLFMFFSNIFTERARMQQSDFSDGWIMDGSEINIGSFSTKSRTPVTLYKKLPETIAHNDTLCFLSNNAFFDIYLGEELIYTYVHPKNFTGSGYGIAYHSVNLCHEYAGKDIRIDIYGAFPKGVGGSIKMMSLEDYRTYSSRMAKGQLLSFVISCGISIIGFLMFILRVMIGKKTESLDTTALSLTAITLGIWMALDTGFLRLVADATMFSRTLSYICMYICLLPFTGFIYSYTKERSKLFFNLTWCLSIVFLAGMLIARFAFNLDMGNRIMIRIYFVYSVVMLVTDILMFTNDRAYCRKNGIERDTTMLTLGIGALFISGLVDMVIYLSGVRSISGSITFLRIGAYVFFITMGIEVFNTWVREYASLRKYGFIDELTGIGNRRAYISFEDEHKDICPFGYVMCDINALKKTNDTFGHDKGDELIKNVTDKLVNIFGSRKVFRVGGDEFVAYSFEETEEGFNDQIIRARKALSDKDCSASIGGVYSMLKPDNLGAIKKKAEDIMYAEKDLYYITNDEPRRK